MGGASAPQDKSSDASPKPKRKVMDYIKKLERIDEHLKKHPADYQSVISRMKTYSNAVEHEMYLRKIERLKRMSDYRRKKNGEKQGF